MTRPANQQLLPYEELLRTVGAHLDAEDARTMSVLETLDGFVVRYECGGDNAPRLCSFSSEDLSGRREARGTGNPDETGRYQDFLRALGHELEEEKAWSALVDELADGFLVSYENLDQKHGYQAVKHRVTLGAREQGTLVDQGHGRRADVPADKGGLFSWLFH